MEPSEWYINLREKISGEKKSSTDNKKPLLICCGWVDSHADTCVHFQPEGDLHTNRFVPHGGHGYYSSVKDCFGFDTTNELLANSRFHNWPSMKGFYRYSLSNYYDPYSLMAEFDNGYEWWCLGYIRNGLALELPLWEPKYR